MDRSLYTGARRFVDRAATIVIWRAVRAGFILRLMRSISLLRLDYISCALTLLSTVLVGRRYWHGWVIAALNSAVICVIGIKTQQIGFVPANLLCILLYAHNLHSWRKGARA